MDSKDTCALSCVALLHTAECCVVYADVPSAPVITFASQGLPPASKTVTDLLMLALLVGCSATDLLPLAGCCWTSIVCAEMLNPSAEDLAAGATAVCACMTPAEWRGGMTPAVVV
jgi:hypothetical protein